jgi:hypothetical protein
MRQLNPQYRSLQLSSLLFTPQTRLDSVLSSRIAEAFSILSGEL